MKMWIEYGMLLSSKFGQKEPVRRNSCRWNSIESPLNHKLHTENPIFVGNLTHCDCILTRSMIPVFPINTATDNKLQILSPVFLQSCILRPSTPPDVPEDAINRSRADEDPNLSTLSPPDRNKMATIWRRYFGNPSLLAASVFSFHFVVLLPQLNDC